MIQATKTLDNIYRILAAGDNGKSSGRRSKQFLCNTIEHRRYAKVEAEK